MRRSHQRWLVGLAFTGLLFVGLLIHRDYGISWDEQSARLTRGEPNFLFLARGDRSALECSRGKHHGPAFEIGLFFLEKALRLHDTQAIFFMRHLVTFLFFFGAVVVFYGLLRRRFHSRGLGFAGAAFLVLSPRIFADAFYNSKDGAFLCAYIFSLATLTRFLRRPATGSAALHALACGFLIAIRIPGVVVPLLTFVLLPVRWLAQGNRGETPEACWTPLAWLAVLTPLFVTLFWPVLWENPPLAFARTFEVMRRYPWQGTVFYCGAETPADQLPWHYLPWWMLITTPIFYSLLFAVGVGRFFVEIVRNQSRILARRTVDVVWAGAFFLPLVGVIGLGATVYDGWRHLYFVYPAFLFFAVFGLATLLAGVRLLARRSRLAWPLFLAACTVPPLAIGWVMVRDHPYQNLYFNDLAGPDMQTIKSRYEMDYWGLSCREGLEKLLALDPSPVVRIYGETLPVAHSVMMLAPEQRARVRLTHRLDQADYYISHYRRHRWEFPEGRDVCTVRVGNAKVFVAQRVRDRRKP